jgi:hypothetical protein
MVCFKYLMFSYKFLYSIRYKESNETVNVKKKKKCEKAVVACFKAQRVLFIFFPRMQSLYAIKLPCSGTR